MTFFDYGFSEDSPMRLPAVSVEVAAGMYNANNTFQSPEASLLGKLSKQGKTAAHAPDYL